MAGISDASIVVRPSKLSVKYIYSARACYIGFCRTVLFSIIVFVPIGVTLGLFNRNLQFWLCLSLLFDMMPHTFYVCPQVSQRASKEDPVAFKGRGLPDT